MDMIVNINFLKNNTAGTVGFQACGDEGLPLSVKQEAHPIALPGWVVHIDYKWALGMLTDNIDEVIEGFEKSL